MPTIDGVVVKCFPGYNIVKLTMKLDKTLKGHIELSPFDYIIVHVGTNNIDRRDSFDNIIADYGNLIPVIKKNNSSIRIIMSAILPRPVDHDETDEMIKKGTATLMITMFYMKDFNKPWILIPVLSKSVDKCGSYWRLNICKWTVMEAAIV